MQTQDLIQAYARDVPNKYRMENPTLVYQESNRVCSDVVEVFLRIQDTVLEEFSFDGYMSITATACVAITWELLEGRSIEEILSYDESFIHEYIGADISPRRRHASLIGLLAIKNALHTYLNDGKHEDFSDIEVD